VIVKVCGVSTPEVATAAVDAGADWIGLVFVAGSPRNVDAGAADEVVSAVAGGAELIGVVVSPSAMRCNELAERHGLAAVQVHGDVSRQLVEDCQVPVIRGINVATEADAYTIDWWPDALVLLDAAPEDSTALPGGTGLAVPLRWAAIVARHRPVILAGGLGPGNVGDAIAAVLPRGVDASSGLETAPGMKDVGLVRAYVRSARAAFDLVAGVQATAGSPS
jgi:phosphoribosylanthranilate isomerase